MNDQLITPEEIAHLEKLMNTPVFDDDDLIELAKEFPEDE